MIAGLRNPRIAFGLGAAVCMALLGFAYYLQYVKGLEPCPLCMVQRFFFYAVMAFFILAAIHGPRGRGAFVYSALVTLFAVGGAAAAGRQIWLQHLPPDKVPQCGPDLFFMLENFPLSRTWEKLFYGTGECAKIDWTFLGMSIADWSLVWFIALGIYAWLAARRPPARA